MARPRHLAHHRDGTAFEVWGVLPMFNDHVSLSLGAGAYYYYDTQPLPGGTTANVHGTAPIYSLAATTYLMVNFMKTGQFFAEYCHFTFSLLLFPEQFGQ